MFKSNFTLLISSSLKLKIAPRSDNKYVDMIRVVDGVGQKKAEDILKQFKVYELWDVSEKDLRNSVKGIGAKQAENIKKVFHRW